MIAKFIIQVCIDNVTVEVLIIDQLYFVLHWIVCTILKTESYVIIKYPQVLLYCKFHSNQII